MNLQSVKDNGTRTIVYCRSKVRDALQRQEKKILSYAKAQGYVVTETFKESGTMDYLTYHSLRLRAKYREFDILLVADLEVLGNSPIEIMHEINFLMEKGVKVISLKDGELNVESLPLLFRKMFRLIGHNN